MPLAELHRAGGGEGAQAANPAASNDVQVPPGAVLRIFTPPGGGSTLVRSVSAVAPVLDVNVDGAAVPPPILQHPMMRRRRLWLLFGFVPRPAAAAN